MNNNKKKNKKYGQKRSINSLQMNLQKNRNFMNKRNEIWKGNLLGWTMMGREPLNQRRLSDSWWKKMGLEKKRQRSWLRKLSIILIKMAMEGFH